MTKPESCQSSLDEFLSTEAALGRKAFVEFKSATCSVITTTPESDVDKFPLDARHSGCKLERLRCPDSGEQSQDRMVESGLNRELEKRLRLRELSKYYCATTSLPKPKVTSQNDAEHAQRHRGVDDYQPVQPHLSTDNQLTALAQLAATRLDCKRCFISILDDETQHVIAEATRTISTFDEDDHEADDGLLLGVQSLPLGYGICATTIGAFTGQCEPEFESPNTEAGEDYICIPDLQVEPKILAVPGLRGMEAVFRYYLEVPLKTETGYVIGSVCVIDPSVRKASPKHVKLLQEVSKLIMQHLESSRMKEDHKRAERLLEGLSHFIRGKDSLSTWSQNTKGQEEIPSAYPEPSELSSMRFLRDTKTSVPSLGSIPSSTPVDTASNATTPLDTVETFQDSVSTPATFTDPPTNPIRRHAASITSGTDVETGYDPLPERTSSNDLQGITIASLTVRQAFSRAANLLRESMDLDASCFLEVPQNERFKNLKQAKSSRAKQVEGSDANLTSQSSSESSSENDATPRDGRTSPNNLSSTHSDALCHRLGFSTRAKSSLAGSTTNHGYLTLPAVLLSRLTTKYPQGHIFHFDSAGSVSSGSEEQEEQLKPKQNSRQRRKKLSSKLFTLFPSATSLIFLPLYDNDKQQIYAGYLGWTTNPRRGLQKNELVYVSGFANSIMCEVMRLEALATDKAKSDFISSISHELRSPLHGILAASQLLTESQTYPKQAEFLSMIDTCARTLLDIMNHLLDHAKINHFTKQQEQKRPKVSSKRTESNTYSLVTDLNLLSIVEDTTVSMAASSMPTYHQPGRSLSGVTPLGGLSSARGRSPPSIPLILDILPQDHWTFKSEAGSWRRIIMNLIGNSMKYTQHGHIHVSLSFKNDPKARGGRMVELKVIDTGQGISEEYLKHRLYTPFAQENNLSVGAGLGLSLVQKIVSSLQGKIQIHSEMGSGTEVIVTVPLESCETVEDQLTDADDDGLKASMRGRSVQFLGFDDRPSLHEQPTGIPDPRTNAMIVMKHSLQSTLTEWFDVKIVNDHAEFLVIEEKFLESEMETYDHATNKLLVVGLDGRNNTTDQIKHANYVDLLPPVGPIRMSQALKTLLRENNRRDEESPSSPIPGPPVRPRLPSRSRYTYDVSSYPTTASVPQSRSESSQTVFKAPVPTTKEALLLVDDNDINLRILSACVARLNLSDRGIECITAVNGQDALDKYKHAFATGTRIDVVFMDISMPIMDGFTCTREIRAFEKAKGMRREVRSKIVALTGLASAEAQNEADSCGFDLYLRKPVNLKTVREILTDDRIKVLPDNQE